MRTFHGTTWVVLMLQCSSSLCLLSLPNKPGGRIAMTPRNDPLFLVFDTHEGQSPTILWRRPDRCTATRTSIADTFSSTRSWQSASDNDNTDNPNETQTQGNATSIYVQQQKQQEGKLQRWTKTARLRLKTFLQKGRSLLTGRRARDITQVEATTSDSSSFSPRDEKDGKNDSASVSTASSSSSINSDVDADENRNDDCSLALLPKGPRWAIANPETDLSGTWKPLITSEFRNAYDIYLQNCGTSFVFRHVCLNFCSTARETIQQQDQGRVLNLTGTSPVGNWKRSLISSGADLTSEDYEIVHSEFLDPDKELVKVEAWWEDQGRVHKSFLRNKPKVCGGEIESRRYLVTDEETGAIQLVCESIFHPSEEHLSQQTSSSRFKPAFVRWKYQRV